MRDEFLSQIRGSWEPDYSWPRMRREYGSRGGGKTQDQQQSKRIFDLVNGNRRLFWEARRDSPIIAKSIEIGLSEGLEESEALLLAVVALLEQNRELMKNAMAVIDSSPLPTVFAYLEKLE